VISASISLILEGKHDDPPEQAFYMVGGIDEVVEKVKRLAEWPEDVEMADERSRSPKAAKLLQVPSI
jgi:hypothetical protein